MKCVAAKKCGGNWPLKYSLLLDFPLIIQNSKFSYYGHYILITGLQRASDSLKEKNPAGTWPNSLKTGENE